ncbi:hypothetical protein [Collinsella sp. AF38-3AC]|uniref:hypothetical protein n=1 Tax=Collinsella sp. AF38-3AC TaxID=2292015 RepID=UPI000E4D75F0|nr:hypothetical protein [Collinsella sp. AF38-3AC]RHL25407.1 hypothetical protein DW029_02950 [Collinsella sp. AF38-3AC]
MPSISDEAGIKLLNILEMFGREMLRNKINESNRLRAEANEANEAAKGLSNHGKGMREQNYTTTWFDSPAEAQATLRELKQLSPKLFANSTVVGHFLVHPKDQKGSNSIQYAIYDISRDHRYASRAIELRNLEKSKSEKGYLKSQSDGECTRFSLGKAGDEAASFNAAYYCSVLQDYNINARHIGNEIVLDKADEGRALEAMDIEKRKVEAMGPERGEMFMRQRFKDRIGVEYEPPAFTDYTEGYDEAGGDMGAELPESVESDIKTVVDGRESNESDKDGSGPFADGKTGPESSEEIAEEELAAKTVESSPVGKSEGELSAEDADETLSREARKAELHEDISNSKTTADCVQARPDAHNGDLSTPYADGQDAPGTGDTDGDGIRDSAEDRDGDGTPDRLDSDAEYIDNDPDYEPISMKERDIDGLMSDKSEESAFENSRAAAREAKDVSLETVNR